MDEIEQLRADLARVTAKLAASERECSKLIDQRDALEESINAIHAMTGCEREWSNLHDCAACAVVGVGEMASAEQLRAVTEERDALRSIVEGRTVAPTREEVGAHRGLWMVAFPSGDVDIVSPVIAQLLRRREAIHAGCPVRWWVIRDGRLCAWPEVPRE